MLKPYLNHIKLIHGDYFIHIKAIYVSNVAYISPIPVPYIINIAIRTIVAKGYNFLARICKSKRFSFR